MDIKVQIIDRTQKEQVQIRCHEVTDSVREIVSFVKSYQGLITGTIEGEQYEIPMSDIFYIESVDDRVFLYCREIVYETRKKLYELEEIMGQKQFFRISRSCIVNLMKVTGIRPAMNGRYTAALSSGEKVVISRKYVPALKKKLKGE